MDPILIASVFFIGLIIAAFALLKRQPTGLTFSNENKVLKKAEENVKEQNDSAAKVSKKKNASQEKSATSNKQHPLMAAQLKGHTDAILDMKYVPNGYEIVTTSLDRTLRIWSVKDLSTKDFKFTRVNVDLDHGMSVHFAPDCRAFIIGLGQKKTLRLFKHSKKETSAVMDAPEKSPNPVDIIATGLAATDHYKYMMTCHADTSMFLWGLKGDLLHKFDSQKMGNTHAAVTPSGQFVGVSGFTPDVKLYEVKMGKNNVFEGVHQAMDLTGHHASILHFAFSADSTRAVTVSKDKTWRLHNINVLYKQAEDPRLVGSCEFSFNGVDARCAISPDLQTVAIASGTCLQVFSAQGKLLGTIEDAHKERITSIDFDAESLYIATASRDKSCRIWHNKWGLEAKIGYLKEESIKCTKPIQKERIATLIDKTEEQLANIKV